MITKQTTRTYIESSIPRRLSIVSIAGKLVCPGFIFRHSIAVYKENDSGYIAERHLHYNILSMDQIQLPSSITIHYQQHKIMVTNIKGTIYVSSTGNTLWSPLNPAMSSRLARLIGQIYLWLFSMTNDIKKVLVPHNNYLYTISELNDYSDYIFISLRYPFRLGVLIGGICEYCRYREVCYGHLQLDKEAKKARSYLQSILDSATPSRYAVRQLLRAALKGLSQKKSRKGGRSSADH